MPGRENIVTSLDYGVLRFPVPNRGSKIVGGVPYGVSPFLLSILYNIGEIHHEMLNMQTGSTGNHSQG